MHKASDHPEPTLQTTALRYAASDLSPGEASAFESRLADDQEARDALSEAVRLSAAALGQAAPEPDHTFRSAMRERLTGWCPDWLARRAYRGHPLAWAGLGAVVVTMCTFVGLSFAKRAPEAAQVASPLPAPTFPGLVQTQAVEEPAPMPQEVEPPTAVNATPAVCGDAATQSVAEMWAQLSTTEHVEKTHDEEMRWRHKFHGGSVLFPVRPQTGDAIREP